MKKILLISLVAAILNFNCAYADESYKVTFIDGDRVISSQVVQKGGSAQPPENYSSQNKSFVRWKGNYSNITDNTKIYALHTYDKDDSESPTDSAADLFNKSNKAQSNSTVKQPANQKQTVNSSEEELSDSSVVSSNYVRDPELDSQYKEVVNKSKSKSEAETPSVNPIYFYGAIIAVIVVSFLITLIYLL